MPSERSKDKPATVSATGRKLVFTTLVSKEGFDFTIKGIGALELWADTQFYSASQSLAKIACLKTDKRPLSVTLEIEPVDRASQIQPTDLHL